VGDENIFLFGLTADEVAVKKRQGYQAYEYYNANPALRAVLDQIARGFDDGVCYDQLVNRLLFGGDEYMLLADFESYRKTHDEMVKAYSEREKWTRMSLLNTAAAGYFAADRSIDEYAQKFWNLKPVH
jgi:starch phosphorylase